MNPMTSLSTPEIGDRASIKQYSTFNVGGFYFGIDVLQVQEVLRNQEMTPVPLAPEVVEGLINLRGQIVTALDMRRRLGLALRSGHQTPMNVVVRNEEGVVSLLVDEIGDVVEADASSFERAPENLDPVIRSLVLGIHKLKDRLLLVLDIDQTLQLAADKEQRAR